MRTVLSPLNADFFVPMDSLGGAQIKKKLFSMIKIIKVLSKYAKFCIVMVSFVLRLDVTG